MENAGPMTVLNMSLKRLSSKISAFMGNVVTYIYMLSYIYMYVCNSVYIYMDTCVLILYIIDI
jgi:hypothetical protein